MPVTASATKLIRIAPGTLWNVWRDLARWPDWQPTISSARWLDGSPWEQGSTFRLLRRGGDGVLGRLVGNAARTSLGQVLSTAEGRLLVWELKSDSASWLIPTTVESVRLDPAPGGTTVSLTLAAHGFASFLVRGALQARADATLEGLWHDVAPIERRL